MLSLINCKSTVGVNKLCIQHNGIFIDLSISYVFRTVRILPKVALFSVFSILTIPSNGYPGKHRKWTQEKNLGIEMYISLDS